MVLFLIFQIFGSFSNFFPNLWPPFFQANAAAYLQHLCYMDDPVKAKTRQLGGIPPLVALLSHEIPDIHKNACGALR